MKKIILFMSMVMLCIYLVACSSGEKFDAEAEKKKATEVVKGVLTSFKDQEKIAEGKNRDETNQKAWEKIENINKEALSKKLGTEDQKRLLYLVTSNKAEDLDNGGIQSNLLFTHDTEIRNIQLNKEKSIFTFDVERSGFDRNLITLEKQEGVWKITKVKEAK
ncbi:hypothetical protein [Neobacillus mesonae]|uniref:hypothetical protein n=1 Tax=Neobacillus mesonae TaxID=1193713 RepID=UPI00203DCB74|nr:hypothetical protein [Neobacillus mesonae]MCM3570610.1 hypothetical protein [Neobacillus mesonae]